MTDNELSLYFNEYRMNAVERILSESGSSLEQELANKFNDLYKCLVPDSERSEIESRIAAERAQAQADRETSRRFAVVHFHQQDDDYHFTTELRNNFYSAASLYRSYLQDETDRLTMDSLALRFGEHQPIDEVTFSVLCDAMPNDFRITALLEFNFDDRTVSVCESSDNAWQTYRLKDVSTAIYRAERKSGLRLETRQEIFAEALQGKEIYFSEYDDLAQPDKSSYEEEPDSPTMQL